VVDPIGLATEWILRGTGGVIRRSGAAATHPLLDRGEFPWLTRLEENWRLIRGEADHARELRLIPVDTRQLNPLSVPVVGRWKLLPLKTHRGWVTAVCSYFPWTVQLLRGIPGLRCADFAALGPGSQIVPHQGTNWGVLRAHLALQVPEGGGRCELAFPADSLRQPWREGEAFIFDDMHEHAAVNERSGERLVLLMEVDRPLAQPARVVNRFALRCYRFHPVVRATHQRLRAVTWIPVAPGDEQQVTLRSRE
jgi:aspartyl/asparaginyl beta-hydroxylase (cupin superfamily)